jgi:hypothetical protein
LEVQQAQIRAPAYPEEITRDEVTGLLNDLVDLYEI